MELKNLKEVEFSVRVEPYYQKLRRGRRDGPCLEAHVKWGKKYMVIEGISAGEYDEIHIYEADGYLFILNLHKVFKYCGLEMFEKDKTRKFGYRKCLSVLYLEYELVPYLGRQGLDQPPTRILKKMMRRF